MVGSIPRLHRHADRSRFERPRLKVRDYSDRREIRIDVYPWPPWFSLILIVIGCGLGRSQHHPGVYSWQAPAVVLAGAGLLLLAPEFLLYRQLRRIRVVCRGDSIRATRGLGPFVQAREIPVAGLRGFFFFRPRKKGRRDSKWGELRRTRLQVGAVSESGAAAVLAPNLPNERMARAVVEALAEYTGLGAAEKKSPGVAHS